MLIKFSVLDSVSFSGFDISRLGSGCSFCPCNLFVLGLLSPRKHYTRLLMEISKGCGYLEYVLSSDLSYSLTVQFFVVYLIREHFSNELVSDIVFFIKFRFLFITLKFYGNNCINVLKLLD